MRRFVVALVAAASVVLAGGAVATAASPLNPVGSVDGLRYDRGLTMNGWAFDPETAASIDVHLYVDGVIAAVVTADQERYDVAAAYPSYGPLHGWTATTGALRAGIHQACAYAINVGVGDSNPVLGCRTLTVGGSAALNPVGSVDQVSLIAQGLYVRGWTLDPETSAPIDVHVYIDGQLAQITRADKQRADIGAAYPAYGAGHGFETFVTPPLPGNHRVCAYAINVGDGTTNPLLGCRDFTVSSYNFGATATFPYGIAAAVGQPQRVVVSSTASPRPSPEYVGVRFAITLTNRTGTTFDPLEDVLLTSGSGGRQAPLTFDSGGAGSSDNYFRGSIPPGGSLTATFLFQVLRSETDQLRLEVAPDFFEDSVYFVGTV